MSVSLSPNHPRLGQGAHGSNGHSSKGWRICRGSKILSFPYQGQSAIRDPCWVPNVIPYLGWGRPARCLVAGWLYWSLFIMRFGERSSNLSSLEYIVIPDMDLRFLPAMLSANVFIYHHSVPFNIASTKEVREREDVCRFHWSHHVSHHLQAHAFTEWYYNLLKTQLW